MSYLALLYVTCLFVWMHVHSVFPESPYVQVDETGKKVRPVQKLRSERCVVILREVPDSTPVEVNLIIDLCGLWISFLLLVSVFVTVLTFKLSFVLCQSLPQHVVSPVQPNTCRL